MKFLDRMSLTKDPNSHDSHVHTHLAHAIVRFLGLTSPQELAEYGIFSTADLVDLVSRVRNFFIIHSLHYESMFIVFLYNSLRPTHLLYLRLL